MASSSWCGARLQFTVDFFTRRPILDCAKGGTDGKKPIYTLFDGFTGGDGDDTFGFFTGYGKDRIMDFDADGSDGHQDLLNAAVPGPADITQVGKNTVIDYGNGDILTLVGVKSADIDATDFL